MIFFFFLPKGLTILDNLILFVECQNETRSNDNIFLLSLFI